MLVLPAILACFMLFDVVVSAMAAAEHAHAWEGFKVCRNGAVYNIHAKRFATRAERARLSCLADLMAV